MKLVKKIRDFLQGKKTYLVALGTIAAALVAFASGEASVIQTLQTIAAALAAMTGRAAYAKGQ